MEPFEAWLAELDELSRRSPGFFAGRPVMLDAGGIFTSREPLADLVARLTAMDIRVMGIDGADPAWLTDGLPPPVSGGRQAGSVEVLPRQEDKRKPSQTLTITQPVRSGQSIVYAHGDVVVIGPVASGAEIVAAGSIHVYGTLRGRALAGSVGNSAARIFCRKFEAELLAIDGLYKTAEELGPSLRGKAVQAWLDGDELTTATLG
jgi:septum site-determining protein MinC